MTSDDTHARTEALLKSHDYFGMQPDQVCVWPVQLYQTCMRQATGSRNLRARTVEANLALVKYAHCCCLLCVQVVLIKQEKVPCLMDNAAHLCLEPSDPYALQTKPHGHGDVHSLLHSSGLARKWQKQGLKWVCFFQVSQLLTFGRGCTLHTPAWHRLS